MTFLLRQLLPKASSANVPFTSYFHMNSCMYTYKLPFLCSCGRNKGLILLLLFLPGSFTGVMQCEMNSQSYYVLLLKKKVYYFNINYMCLLIIMFQLLSSRQGHFKTLFHYILGSNLSLLSSVERLSLTSQGFLR